MSLESDSRAKCPVCRTEGSYERNTDITNKLSTKHVKCPEHDCTWAGTLLDYKWHRRRHDRELARQQPPAPAAQPPRRRHRPPSASTSDSSTLTDTLDSMDVFASRLNRRARNLHDHYTAQESDRRESMEEVESLSRRLGNVAENIVHLLDNMHQDSRRFQQYVDDSPEVDTPDVQEPEIDSQDAFLPVRAARSTSRSNRLDRLLHESQPEPELDTHAMLSPSTTRSTSRSDERLERLLREPQSSNNPFIVPADTVTVSDTLRAPTAWLLHDSLLPRAARMIPRYTPQTAEERVQQLLAEPTPTENPFVLPDDLPAIRPPSSRHRRPTSSTSLGDDLTLSPPLLLPRAAQRSSSEALSRNRDRDVNDNTFNR